MTVNEALRQGAARLAAACIEGPAREARLLLGHATGLSPEELLRRRDDAVVAPGYDALLDRRAAREPLALILGWQEFWSLRFAVSSDTLIPRADSETLIEAALAERPRRDAVRTVLDLGTGTGCLLLAALTEYPGAWGLGIDLSPAAAALARRNALSLGLGGRSAFACGSWGDAVQGRFDLVLSNPPYIPSADIAGLMPEVAGHEPLRALDGGADGLDAYRALITRLPDLLAPGGLAVIELGIDQAGPVRALAHDFRATLRDDLAGIPRALILQHPV